MGSAAELLPEGGSGRYTFTLAAGGSGGEIRGNRLIAGLTPMDDAVSVADDCGNSTNLTVPIIAPFLVEPARATVRPGTQFTVRTQGLIGTAQFSADAIGSGGGISSTGAYTAGSAQGLDLIRVRDTGTGEEVLLQFRVSTTATFKAVPGKLALPAGASVPLVTQDGSGLVDWVKLSGPGTATGGIFTAARTDTGTAELEGTDRFTNEKTRVKVRVLEELSRGGKPHGRLSDVTTVATGDFDGDGIADVAVGVPESDLGRPQGGAVFIYKGSASGLPAEATWRLVGDTDTAQLGAVLVAGDLDGDGKADLAISEPGADVTIADSGAVLLYRFGANGPELIRAPLTGLGRGNFGASLAIADMDGDGDNDLVVGSPGGDLAPTASISARGVIDIFLLQKGQNIPDLGSVRVGGADLAVDGTVKPTTNIRLGRVMAVGDLNGDGRADLAAQVTVNNTLLGGVPAARSQTAIQVHFGRANSNLFEAVPDLYVLPTNSADGNEGTWRLGIVPAESGRPALLMAVADRTDSPNLSTMGGAAGGSDGGGALLYDLSSYKPTGTAAAMPTQIGRTDAWARIYGDASGITAGRSFAVADVDGQPGLELILGAPYASGTNLSTAGKLLSYPLAGLTAGAVVNKPADFRLGAARVETLGTGLAAWNLNGSTALVGVSSRATTAQGDFTGRVDAFQGSGPLAMWTASASVFPARLAAESFGVGIEAVVANGAVKVLVGAPGFSGPGSNNDGNDVGAGQALLYSAGQGSTPQTLVEGAGTAYVKNGVRVYGGRTIGIDVASTDFDGDGRVDLAVSAPNFATPSATSTEYATLVAACAPATGETTGGALVFLGQADGSFKEGFRLFARRDIAGCTPAGSTCQRSNLSRTGLVGGFDWNKDGKQDLLVTRSNGFEIFLGRAPDDASLAKPTMECAPSFTFPWLAQAISMPAALGDVDGDGCDDVGVRYTDNTRVGFIVAFGYDAGGACGTGSTAPSWVRVSGDSEVGVNQMRLGTALARAGRVLGDTRDFLAVTADTFPYMGVAQPVVLLYDYAELKAKKPAAGGAALAGALGDGLNPIPVLYKERAPGLGRSLAATDITGDGVPDLVVGATGANVNGDGTGAVFVFEGGAGLSGPRPSWLTLAADNAERGAFGQDVCVSPAAGALKPALAVGAPASYRTGTFNGSAFVTPLDF